MRRMDETVGFRVNCGSQREREMDVDVDVDGGGVGGYSSAIYCNPSLSVFLPCLQWITWSLQLDVRMMMLG